MPELPQVTISYAQTLDGRLATIDGRSQWISGSESLRFSHQLRAEHAALMVGVGTVLQDNPRLTVRLAAGPDPLRVIVDSKLRTPLAAAVLAGPAASGTLLATTAQAAPERRAALEQLGAQVLLLPADADGKVDLSALLSALAERGLGSLMVEGGAQLITALLRARLVQRMAITVAPRIMGHGLAAIGDLGIRDLAMMPQLADLRIERYGADLVFDARLVYP